MKKQIAMEIYVMIATIQPDKESIPYVIDSKTIPSILQVKA
ncbi:MULTISPECIES: hypothetical protein [Clostridia]|nr:MULTISPECIES: hypothetical protein [Clostridia]